MEYRKLTEHQVQIKLGQLSKILTWLVLGICAVVFAVQVLRAGGFDFEVVLNSFMIAVSLAVAAIPEGLAAVVTVVLSIGVTNMSKRNAIIRRLTAVETLGCAQIICSDKTGTLTQNKMTVVDFFGENKEELAKAMALCCDAEIDENGIVTGEPTEAALVAWANTLGLNKTKMKADFPRCGEAPFDSGRKMMTTVHSAVNGAVQYTKGAPDVVIGKCSHYLKDGEPVPMTEEYREKILAANKEMADRALRVLACAIRVYSEEPESFEAEELETELCFIGLTGMIDPVRPEVKDAIDECVSAGVRAIMITGDHVDTAVAIAKELGILREGDKAITGSQLSEMSDEEFEKEFMNISVYARVQPEHKTRIVNAWRKAGYVTAMTGDGVNDAPAVKEADIGVSMGKNGTDVTREASGIVLLDDDFSTLVAAVEEGRIIYQNIRKFIRYLLSCNIGEVVTMFFGTLLGFPAVLFPIQILMVNLVIDGIPAIALSFDPAHDDVMKIPPRKKEESVFSGGLSGKIIFRGILLGFSVLAAFLAVLKISGSLAEARTGAYVTLVFTQLVAVFECKSEDRSLFTIRFGNNKKLIGAALSSAVLVLLTVLWEPAAAVFQTAALTQSDWLIIAIATGTVPLLSSLWHFVRWGK